MKKTSPFLFFLLMAFGCKAIQYTGTYIFNKGVNKASGTLYVSQFGDDSAFIMLQAVSGMPDFLTCDLKGFIKINQTNGLFIGKDSCDVQFTFTSTKCSLQENEACHNEFSPNASYKKVNAQIKKSVNFLPNFASKNGKVLHDSVFAYSIPHQTGLTSLIIPTKNVVQINDEFKGYYLVELPSKKNEFIWVPKKNIQIIKNK